MRPRISIVVARARNGVIGAGGRLPWSLPADLRHFRGVTMGKPVIMGRRTWESLGRALPGRRNIVVTRQRGYAAPGAEVAPSWEAALALAGAVPEIMVIGGADLYRAALPHADRILLTEVDADVEGDVVFPELDRAAWVEVAREWCNADERHAWAYAFVTLDRVRAANRG